MEQILKKDGKLKKIYKVLIGKEMSFYNSDTKEDHWKYNVKL